MPKIAKNFHKKFCLPTQKHEADLALPLWPAYLIRRGPILASMVFSMRWPVNIYIIVLMLHSF